MSWNPITQPQDKVILADRVSPGLCEITGAANLRKWDELESYGASGALLVYRGLKLAHFSIVLSLYTEADWTEWAAFRPLVMRPPIGKRPRALTVVHPVLNEVDITALVVESVEAPAQSEDGVWTIEIKCIEWRKLAQSISKPDGAEATAVDPWDLEEQRLVDQVNRLANDPGNP